MPPSSASNFVFGVDQREVALEDVGRPRAVVADDRRDFVGRGLAAHACEFVAAEFCTEDFTPFGDRRRCRSSRSRPSSSRGDREPLSSSPCSSAAGCRRSPPRPARSAPSASLLDFFGRGQFFDFFDFSGVGRVVGADEAVLFGAEFFFHLPAFVAGAAADAFVADRRAARAGRFRSRGVERPFPRLPGLRAGTTSPRP